MIDVRSVRGNALSFAVWSAPHVFTSVSQMNCVMIAPFCAEVWAYDVRSTGSNDVSFRLSNPVANLISGTLHLPKLPIPAPAVEPAAAVVVAW